MKMTARKLRLMTLGTLALLAVMQWAWGSSAEKESTGDKKRQQPAPMTESRREAPDISSGVPLADLAGAQKEHLAPRMTNPMAKDPAAVERGFALFKTMNCAGCHGYDGKGGMGPDLSDQFWLYGGTPVMIFKSIEEGRPQGMPSWKNMLPNDSVWDLTAYIESLGGAFPANRYQAALQGDLSKGATRAADKGASPNTRGRR